LEGVAVEMVELLLLETAALETGATTEEVVAAAELETGATTEEVVAAAELVMALLELEEAAGALETGRMMVEVLRMVETRVEVFW